MSEGDDSNTVLSACVWYDDRCLPCVECISTQFSLVI